MVYTAMKMFMEINPQLFDDCSHDYREYQNSAEAREKSRQEKWERLAEMAKAKREKAELPPVEGSKSPDAAGSNDGLDPLTQDNQQRLNALKLQDDTAASKERRREGQNSVSASRVD